MSEIQITLALSERTTKDFATGRMVFKLVAFSGSLRTSFSNMQKYMGVPLTIIEPTVALNLFGGQAYFGKNAGETDTLVDEATIEGVKQILRAFLEEPTAA